MRSQKKKQNASGKLNCIIPIPTNEEWPRPKPWIPRAEAKVPSSSEEVPVCVQHKACYKWICTLLVPESDKRVICLPAIIAMSRRRRFCQPMGAGRTSQITLRRRCRSIRNATAPRRGSSSRAISLECLTLHWQCRRVSSIGSTIWGGITTRPDKICAVCGWVGPQRSTG